MSRSLLPCLLGVVLAGIPATLAAQCNLAPTAFADSVKVETNDVLVDVLANDVDPESQELAVTVTGHTCSGNVSQDSYQLLEIEAPLAADCQVNYRITDPGGLTATATVTVDLVDELFSDDFETGNTQKWDSP